MAKLDAIRVSTVFAANPQLNARTSLVSLLHGHFDELAHTGLIDCSEGILLDDFQFLVRPEEGARVIPAHAEAGLRQIVGAEAEKLSRLRNLVSRERSPRHLNHCAHQVIELDSFLLHDFTRNAMNDFDL